MKPLTVEDIQPIPVYESQRDAFRRRVIDLKKIRRAHVGPRVAVVFENRDTMLFQVQEMCRIEHISDKRLIQQEVDVYNDLLPEGLAIGATLLIELIQTDDMPKILKDLSGLEETVWLRFGAEAIHAEAELGRSTDEKTSSVHYITFRFTPATRKGLLEAEKVTLHTEHPNYRFSVDLPRETVASLLADLLDI